MKEDNEGSLGCLIVLIVFALCIFLILHKDDVPGWIAYTLSFPWWFYLVCIFIVLVTIWNIAMLNAIVNRIVEVNAKIKDMKNKIDKNEWELKSLQGSCFNYFGDMDGTKYILVGMHRKLAELECEVARLKDKEAGETEDDGESGA